MSFKSGRINSKYALTIMMEFVTVVLFTEKAAMRQAIPYTIRKSVNQKDVVREDHPAPLVYYSRIDMHGPRSPLCRSRTVIVYKPPTCSRCFVWWRHVLYRHRLAPWRSRGGSREHMHPTEEHRRWGTNVPKKMCMDIEYLNFRIYSLISDQIHIVIADTWVAISGKSIR